MGIFSLHSLIMYLFFGWWGAWGGGLITFIFYVVRSTDKVQVKSHLKQQKKIKVNVTDVRRNANMDGINNTKEQ